jgi:hypothetical protein
MSDATKYPWTGELSFSLLKLMGTSPAHFRYACDHPMVASKAMRLGTLVHWHLLGGPEDRKPLVYLGDKVKDPKSWKAFKEENAGRELYGRDEWDEADVIADAVSAAPHNRPLWQEWIEGGEYEIPLSWTAHGIPCRTRGVDIIHRARGRLGELKTARSSEPVAFGWQARRMFYAEQLAFYSQGMAANGYEAKDHFIFVVDPSQPRVCTVVTLSPVVLDQARLVVLGWFDRLHACLKRDEWPGYSTKAVEFDAGPINLDTSDLEEMSTDE